MLDNDGEISDNFKVSGTQTHTDFYACNQSLKSIICINIAFHEIDASPADFMRISGSMDMLVTT